MPTGNLYPVSTVTVNSLTAEIDNNILKMKCNVSIPKQRALTSIRFFMQTNPEVSCDGATTTKNISHSFPVVNGDNTITAWIPSFKECGYKSGDVVYLKAYGDIRQSRFYFNPFTSKFVFPSVNPNSNSSVISVLVP